MNSFSHPPLLCALRTANAADNRIIGIRSNTINRHIKQRKNQIAYNSHQNQQRQIHQAEKSKQLIPLVLSVAGLVVSAFFLSGVFGVVIAGVMALSVWFAVLAPVRSAQQSRHRSPEWYRPPEAAHPGTRHRSSGGGSRPLHPRGTCFP